MNWEELNSVFSALDERVKMELEQTRLLIHSIYQVNSTKKLKPTDVMRFEWEKETTDTNKLASLEDAERLVNNMKNGKTI